jgi:hypothetical protein
VWQGGQCCVDVFKDLFFVLVVLVSGESFAWGVLFVVLWEREDGEGGEVVRNGGGDGAGGGGGVVERGQCDVNAGAGVGVDRVMAGGSGDGCVEGVVEEEVVEVWFEFEEVDVDVANNCYGCGGVFGEDVVKEVLEVGGEVVRY